MISYITFYAITSFSLSQNLVWILNISLSVMQCPWKALFDVTFGSILIVNFLSSNPHQFFIIIEFAVDLEIMLEVTCIKRIIFFQTIWLFRPYGLFVHDLLVLNLTRRLNSLEDIPLSFLLSVSKCMIILDIDVFCKLKM